MKAKSLLILFLVTAGVFTYLYFGIEKPAKEKEASGGKEDVLATGKFESLQSIKIVSSEKRIELQREPIGWRIISPQKDLASQSKVESIISAFERFKKTRVLIPAEKLRSEKTDLTQYGLNPSKLTIEYKTSDLPDPVVLQIGNQNPSGNATYAKTEKEGLVMATMDLDFLNTQSVEDFREMRFTTVAASDFEEVELTYQGKKTKFKRENDQWAMSEPYKLPLDTEFVKSFMDKIGFVRANKFLSLPSTLSLNRPDIRLVVGFKKDVKDLRTNESDPRPSGLEISLFRVKKAKDKKSKDKAEEFEYYAKSDKAGGATLAQFHYENFTKVPEDFIKKTFDLFLNASIEKALVSKPKVADFSISKTDKGFALNSGSNSSEADADKVNKAFDKLRTLRASKFLELMKTKKAKADLSVTLTLKEASPLTFSFDFAKDSTLLWFTQGDQVLKYALAKDAISSNDFAFESLKASPTKETEKPGSTPGKKP
jgi:hypothetical protein